MKTVVIGSFRVSFRDKAVSLESLENSALKVILNEHESRELFSFLLGVYDIASNKRQAFRVPVLEEDFESVVVEIGAGTFPGNPIDISVTGVLVDLRLPPNSALPIGLTVEVALRRRGRTLTLHGQVRRHDGRRYGIMFLESFKGEEIDPPKLLVEWVMELQHRWVRRKRGLE